MPFRRFDLCTVEWFLLRSTSEGIAEIQLTDRKSFDYHASIPSEGQEHEIRRRRTIPVSEQGTSRPLSPGPVGTISQQGGLVW